MMRKLVLIGLMIECVAIFGLFIPYEMIRQNGTPVTLRTVPIDPRSVFRGDYVTLGYEAGEDLPVNWNSPVVYAVLEQRGDVYEREGAFLAEKPALQPGQVCLRGRPLWQQVEFRDIAQYFVPEGLGRQLEDARNAHRLLVDVSVDGNCRAVIRGIRLGAEVPPEELDAWERDRFLPPGVMVPPPRAEPAPL